MALATSTIRAGAAALLAALGILGCRGAPATGWTRTLGAEAVARLVPDQAVRDTLLGQVNAQGQPSLAILRSMGAVDSANLEWLKPLLTKFGWPTRAMLDSIQIDAIFLLVQHADRDPAFQAEMLPKLEAAHRAGEIPGQALALLTDRVAKAQGRPQVYGTQTTFHDRIAVIDRIGDSAGVDARRAAVGLPPLAVYKRMLDSAIAAAGR